MKRPVHSDRPFHLWIDVGAPGCHEDPPQSQRVTMKDLSTGSIPGHVASMSTQMFIGMVVQVAYFVTDLKFVSMIGNNVAAGFSVAGNLWFFVLALTQILNVGTAAMVSHAVGAKQHERANLIFNQSLGMSVFLGVFVLVI